MQIPHTYLLQVPFKSKYHKECVRVQTYDTTGRTCTAESTEMLPTEPHSLKLDSSMISPFIGIASITPILRKAVDRPEHKNMCINNNSTIQLNVV